MARCNGNLEGFLIKGSTVVKRSRKVSEKYPVRLPVRMTHFCGSIRKRGKKYPSIISCVWASVHTSSQQLLVTYTPLPLPLPKPLTLSQPPPQTSQEYPRFVAYVSMFRGPSLSHSSVENSRAGRGGHWHPCNTFDAMTIDEMLWIPKPLGL